MKLLRLISAVALVGSFLLAPAAQAEGSWQTDYKQALQETKANNKLLLVNFTGSDWCGWCIKFDKEVFSQAKFKEYANKNLVLLEVDFPRAKEQAITLKKQNQELASQYQVEGFPTLVVLNGDGKKVWEHGGYLPGGPDAFIAELEKLRKG